MHGKLEHIFLARQNFLIGLKNLHMQIMFSRPSRSKLEMINRVYVSSQAAGTSTTDLVTLLPDIYTWQL